MRPRPTNYKGTAMRSRLEARFAQFLDVHGASWDYEPECFANEQGQYLPDFLIYKPPCGFDVYVEIKPHAAAAAKALRWMNIIRESFRFEPYGSCGLAVVISDNAWPNPAFGFYAGCTPGGAWTTFLRPPTIESVLVAESPWTPCECQPTLPLPGDAA